MSFLKYARFVQRTGGQSEVALIERGWDDQVVDPARYRLKAGFRRSSWFLGGALPKSDISVLLSGDPARIFARKPELPLTEIKRQIGAWRGLAPQRSHSFMEFDSTLSGADEIATHIADCVVATISDTDHWYALKPGSARVDVRLLARRGALIAAHIYEPTRPRARFATVVARSLYRGGIRHKSSNPIPGLRPILEAHRLGGLAIATMRSSKEGRYIVGVADDSNLVALLKIGMLDDDRLTNEAHFLKNLHPTGLVPSLISYGEHGGRRVLVTAAASRTGRSSSISVAQAQSITTRLQSGSCPIVHGDFTPWNLIPTASGLMVIDWEFAFSAFRPLYDLAHFVFQSAGLVNRWSAQEALSLLTSRGSPGAKELETLGIELSAAKRLVHDYLAVAPETRDPKLISFRAQVQRLIE